MISQSLTTIKAVSHKIMMIASEPSAVVISGTGLAVNGGIFAYILSAAEVIHEAHIILIASQLIGLVIVLYTFILMRRRWVLEERIKLAEEAKLKAETEAIQSSKVKKQKKESTFF